MPGRSPLAQPPSLPPEVAAERENELLTYQMNQVLYSDMKSMYEFEHCADASFSGLGFCRDQREFSHLLEEFFNEHGNSVRASRPCRFCRFVGLL